ncbi:MAG: SOS response-associated peptidase [Lachnospiraceae bacterium]|jgi:putative SOS response-associated peptidase YedK|nr:SOS response-associated peptidase [Lachnospiraceae bacterium]
MCGIYHIGRELDSGIESLMKMVNRERRKESRGRRGEEDEEFGEGMRRRGEWVECTERLREAVNRFNDGAAKWLPVAISDRDIRPTEEAPVLADFENQVILKNVRWGLPGFQKGQVIFNARSETALEKGMFREGVLHHRIVIPAVSFYEWNRRREKNVFTRPDGKILYMAGFCKGEGGEVRFTILTTAANESMLPVHDRMPLILEESEIEPWLYREDWTESLLRKIPGSLSREAEYEQLSLF